MKIAFLENWFDGTNIVKMPQGIGFYITEALKKQGAEVEIIHPAVSGQFPYKIKQFFYKYFTNKKYFRHAEETLLRKEAKIRSEILKKSDADFIFSFGSLASVFLETDKKIAFWADGCFKGLHNYNSLYTNLTKQTENNFHNFEQLGMNKANIIFYPSEWARETAIQNYNVPLEKITLAPFGANMEIDNTVEEINQMIDSRNTNPKVCKLLIIGNNWKYKGVDIAIDITKKLNEKGFATELVIIGCRSNETNFPSYIKIVDFLDKNLKNELDILLDYYRDAHFYIMPTLTETFGHVFCEANAFGVPAISHKTGGVPSVITNGKNGQLFEIGENIDNFCNYIIDNFENKERYKELCLSSFNEYKTRLNWDYGAKIVIDTMKKLL